MRPKAEGDTAQQFPRLPTERDLFATIPITALSKRHLYVTSQSVKASESWSSSSPGVKGPDGGDGGGADTGGKDSRC